jgi:phytoene dehydrogenase-like protein
MGALTADQVLYNHFGYRTPLEGLYVAGSATHPNGAITGGAGYIAAGLIARDIGLEPWWTPTEARTHLAGLGSATARAP